MKQKIGILCSCAVIMSYLAISPVIADIARAFPGTNISAVQMIITLPSLMSLVFSLLAGKLARIFYKKTLILISLTAYLIGGLLPVIFHQSIIFLLVCSGIIGIGNGGMLTLSAAIICDYYTGKERNRMMGLQSAAISGGAMVFSMLGGLLSKNGWSSAYLAFLLLIPCIVITALFMPRGIPEKDAAGNETVTKSSTGNRLALGRSISGYVWFFSAIGFFYYICQNTYNTNVSLYIEEAQLGTAQTTSIATSVYTFSGILAGLLLERLMHATKKYSLIFAMVISSLGLLLAYIGPSLPFIILGGFLCGYGFSTFTPAGTCLVSDHAVAGQRSMSIAIFSTFTNVGSSLSPVIVNAFTGAVGMTTVRSKLIVTAIGLAVVTIAAAVRTAAQKD